MRCDAGSRPCIVARLAWKLSLDSPKISVTLALMHLSGGNMRRGEFNLKVGDRVKLNPANAGSHFKHLMERELTSEDSRKVFTVTNIFVGICDENITQCTCNHFVDLDNGSNLTSFLQDELLIDTIKEAL